MKPNEKFEAKQVAILRHPETSAPVGRLYLWETGEVDPMWFGEEILNAIVEPLSGESSNWAYWTLRGPTEPED